MGRKICERALNRVQIIDYKGTVRLCGWIYNDTIGSLADQNIREIYHSERAEAIREKLFAGDYSSCNIDACPFIAMNDIDNHMTEINEVPEYPEELQLAFENVCNYSCTSCYIHDLMLKNKQEDLEKGYDIIEEKLKKILPYIKRIGANGLGELFCSKRILKLLSEWRPLAPVDEISVGLETNGSLFDEEHWNQIANLGQYHLTVYITIMSFDEPTYQYLSGTKLPLSQIENNLRFVKKLREQGVINHLQLATVVQERNFRTLPDFIKRCIEEFGADSVRLRPYEPWGSQEPEIEWFTDIRNPQHPYYEEYRKVMKSDILKHPKVKEWSGGRDTFNVREFPYRSYRFSFYVERILTDIILNSNKLLDELRKIIPDNNQIVIYGLGSIGKVLVKLFCDSGIRLNYILDKNKPCMKYNGVDIYNLEAAQALGKDVDVLITPLRGIGQIQDDLKKLGYKGKYILVKDLLGDKQLKEEITCLINKE
ncbi:radical SAM/SPASM domain-containing protein [Lachnospiraceae bacterium 62-26]